MKKYWVVCVCFLLALSFMTGCKPEPPPPPPEDLPPPPPSPEEHYNTMKGSMGQLFSDGGITPEEGAALVGAFNGTKMQMAASDNGRIALGMIQRDIEDTMKRSREASRWNKVKVCCELYKILQPGSDRYAKLERDAELMMARPQVLVTGFVRSGNDIYAFIETTNPQTKEKTTFKIREGEEFYQPAMLGSQPNATNLLRLVRIIGDQQAVELEYKPVNFLWEAPGPRARQG